MKKPAFLHAGDTIAIAATARKVSPEEMEPAIHAFKTWGLKVKLSETLYEAEHQFAGTDERRAYGLQQLLDDPEVKAIICARGGYGTVRIIDKLDFTKFAQHPKWIAGFSDITVLHAHIQRYLGIETLHAPMAFNFTPERHDAVSTDSLRRILFGENDLFSVPADVLNRKGKVTGTLVGGNLSVLYSLLGSCTHVDTKGKILFLEDLDEYVYHIDRMMINLKRAGVLEGLKGLIIGGMSEMRDNLVPFGKTAAAIIHEHINEYDYPVCFGFPAGHEKRNVAFRLGAEATLSVSENRSELVF